MSKRNDARTQVIMEDKASVVGDNAIVLQHEQGESLMFRRVLLRPEQELVKELE